MARSGIRILLELIDFDALDYIDVVGDVTSFAGAMQLNIKRVRKAAEDEYDPADLSSCK